MQVARCNVKQHNRALGGACWPVAGVPCRAGLLCSCDRGPAAPAPAAAPPDSRTATPHSRWSCCALLRQEQSLKGRRLPWEPLPAAPAQRPLLSTPAVWRPGPRFACLMARREALRTQRRRQRCSCPPLAPCQPSQLPGSPRCCPRGLASPAGSADPRSLTSTRLGTHFQFNHNLVLLRKRLTLLCRRDAPFSRALVCGCSAARWQASSHFWWSATKSVFLQAAAQGSVGGTVDEQRRCCGVGLQTKRRRHCCYCARQNGSRFLLKLQ